MRRTVLGLVLLGGCAAFGAAPSTEPTDPQITATLTLVQVCQAWGGARDALTPLKAAHKLSDEQLAQIEAMRKVVNPICLEPQAPENIPALVAKVNDAVIRAMLMVNQVTPAPKENP
jgi:hypothetical protein